MKKLTLALLSLFMTSLSFAAFAQDPGNLNTTPATSQHRGGGGQWRSMSPQERQAHRQERRERFQNMTPEERQAFKARRKAQFENLPPERKAAMQARFAERRARRQQRLEQNTNN